MIDLRSDTVTRPTPEMLEAMLQAKVGDDVFDEDPAINELQEFTADMFGVESALFCPSGTMTNQIAIKAQTHPGDEIICDEGAHIHYYEGGGIAFNSGVTTRAVNGKRGVFTASHILESLRPDNVHFPRTSLISIENTCNRGGGKVFGFDEILKIRNLCSEKGLKLHLDGARLFNAISKEGSSPKQYGDVFDSISICLSKGLGAPVGSLLLGDKELIQNAYRIRKILGGGMRQAGYLATAGLYALKNNVERLASDHLLAAEIGTALAKCSYVSNVLEAETNMVVFELKPNIDTTEFLAHLEKNSILAFEVGKQRVRFVTHLDIPSDALLKLEVALKSYS
jgi:threonine aldolase